MCVGAAGGAPRSAGCRAVWRRAGGTGGPRDTGGRGRGPRVCASASPLRGLAALTSGRREGRARRACARRPHTRPLTGPPWPSRRWRPLQAPGGDAEAPPPAAPGPSLHALPHELWAGTGGRCPRGLPGARQRGLRGAVSLRNRHRPAGGRVTLVKGKRRFEGNRGPQTSSPRRSPQSRHPREQLLEALGQLNMPPLPAPTEAARRLAVAPGAGPPSG